ncbi:hypothetical protein [Frankia sp. AgW1.1]|uniref:hypothetical protein n=1 Tax=Frankia sp. AgW1.1 TaxID=1836971 RepID=UPI0019315913|nr:hypothetical protein [Frankia sp. AgW1.1]MBL7487095.1 hypothetical protein [Frankia sp. AgW1.1]
MAGHFTPRGVFAMPVAERLDIFTPFLRKERDADGVLWVEGKFTGPDLDSDGQRMDPDWLKSAIPAYMKVGNVREGHDPHRAIGKAVQVWETDDHSWHMKAKIVDPVAERKIEHGILSGFSIGVANYGLAKAVDAPNGKVCRGDVIEVSAVDRPSLPSAMFRMAELSKATGSLALVDEPELVEGDDLDKAADPAEDTPRPQMLLKTGDGQVRPMTAALVDELTAPSVVANPDDPDARSPEALDKAKKGKKTPPFTSDDKPKADDSGDASDESDDEDDDEKKPATKAADVEHPDLVGLPMSEAVEIMVKRAVAAEMAQRDAPPQIQATEPVETLVEPVLTKAAADDEMDDIGRARRILSDLAVLVQSEAAGFIEGNTAEIWDIRTLADVMAQLQCFVECEEYEMAEAVRAAGEATATSDAADKAATPDLPAAPEAPAVGTPPIVLKSAGSVADEINRRIEKRLKKARKAIAAQNAAETDTDVTKTATPDAPAEDTPVSHGLTFDDLTKALGPLAERLAKVQADNEQTKATLEKVLASPRPGGPAVTRVQPAVSPADAAEKAEKAAQARIVKAMIAANPTPEYRASLMAQLAELEPPAAA